MNKREERQKEALDNLQAQLKAGTKTVKGTSNEKTELTKVDKARIAREIASLQRKLKITTKAKQTADVG